MPRAVRPGGPVVAVLLWVPALLAAQESPTFPKQRVDLPNGISMAYVETGDPTGEPVIFLHGYTDTSRSFWPTIRHLVELRPDLRIFAPDQRGHGDSSMPDAETCPAAPQTCFRMADFAFDVLAFMDAMGIDRAHIVGHSMGSLVAQELALEAPDRVGRLALLASAARTSDHPVIGEFLLAELVEGSWKEALVRQGHAYPEDVYELTSLDADPETARWLIENWVVEATADPAFLASVLPETARTPMGTWIGVVRALDAFDNSERLAELRVPTLVLWPTQDVTFVAADQVALKAALDQAVRACRMRYFFKEYGRQPLPASGLQEDDLGHNFHWGASEAVAQDLAAYLREGGEPTLDQPYADPEDVRRVLTAPGEARIVVGQAEGCPGR